MSSETDPLVALIPDGIRMLAAYQVPRPVDVRAKLDANESPYSLPPELAGELAAHLATVPLNRYPNAGCDELREAVADRMRVSGERLVFGNGSDELIQMLINAFSRPRDGAKRAFIAYPTPSFVWFRLATLGAGAEPLELPLTPEFDLDLPRIRRIFGKTRPNVVFFARPNNPTGTLWSAADVAELASDFPDVLFVSDEAYGEYCDDSMIDDVDRLSNLVVMQTLSKVGLAALRLGFAYGTKAVIGELEKIRPPYNIGALNQAAALWVLESHPDLLSARGAHIIRERARLSASLAKIPGVVVYPSQANLVLVRLGNPGDGQAGMVWAHLAERGIMVRNFDRPGPLAGCLRITVGTPEENDLFLEAFQTAPLSSR